MKGGTFIVSVALLAWYENGCERLDVACPVGFWVQRAAELSRLLAHTVRRRGAIDIFTPCWGKENTTFSSHASPLGVVVRTRYVDPALRNAIEFAPRRWIPKNQQRLVLCLLKWAAWSIRDAEFVVLLDIDVLPFTPLMQRRSKLITRDWLSLFARMRERGLYLVTEPDASSPLNSGIVVLRPSRNIYDEGLQLLQRANSSFNTSHGWDLRGSPKDAIPKSDATWSSRSPAARNLMHVNRWTFYGASIDQGFIFHMHRVAHSLGADLPLRPNPGADRVGRWCIPHCQTKPYAHLPRMPTCLVPHGALGLRRLVTFLRDGVVALSNPGVHILPAWTVAKCVAAWKEALECTRIVAMTTLNVSGWGNLQSADAESVFTHKKCCPACERGSLFFVDP